LTSDEVRPRRKAFATVFVVVLLGAVVVPLFAPSDFAAVETSRADHDGETQVISMTDRNDGESRHTDNPDQNSWSSVVSMPTDGVWNRVVCSDSVCIAGDWGGVGSQRLAITDDGGNTWSMLPSHQPGGIMSIAWDNATDRWVFLISDSVNRYLFYSDDDGETMTQGAVYDAEAAGTPMNVAFGGGGFVAAGTGGANMYWSSDGAAWNQVDGDTGNFCPSPGCGTHGNLAYGPGGWVAFHDGSSNRYLHSSDGGENWTERNLPFSTNLAVGGNENIYTAVEFRSGFPNHIWTTADGVSWTEHSDNGCGDGPSRTVWSPMLDMFVSVMATSAGNSHAVSTDGINWSCYTGGGSEKLDVGVMGLPAPTGNLTILTNQATEITDGQARLNGNLSELGPESSVDVGFHLWEGACVSGSSVSNITETTLTENGAFSTTVSILSADTSYCYRAWADGGSFYWGGDRSFSTESVPAGNTLAASGISDFEATLNAEVTDMGGFDSWNVEFTYHEGTDGCGPDPVCESGNPFPTDCETSEGSTSALADNVEADETYSFWAAIRFYEDSSCSGGAAFSIVGDTLTFNTGEGNGDPGGDPAGNTLAASGVSDFEATLNAEVTDMGGFDSWNVEFTYHEGTDGCGPDPVCESGNPFPTDCETSEGSTSALADNVEADETYSFWAAIRFYEDSSCSGGAAFSIVGDTLTFNTGEGNGDPGGDPAGNTLAASGVSDFEATLNAEVTDMGGFDSWNVEFTYHEGTDGCGPDPVCESGNPFPTDCETSEGSTSALADNVEADETYSFWAAIRFYEDSSCSGGAAFSIVGDTLTFNTGEGNGDPPPDGDPAIGDWSFETIHSFESGWYPMGVSIASNMAGKTAFCLGRLRGLRFLIQMRRFGFVRLRMILVRLSVIGCCLMSRGSFWGRQMWGRWSRCWRILWVVIMRIRRRRCSSSLPRKVRGLFRIGS
jgi:hypothetical protein